MMVSTKGRYALRVMLDLAGQDEEQYISLNDIAGRQQISMKYLEAIVPGNVLLFVLPRKICLLYTSRCV